MFKSLLWSMGIYRPRMRKLGTRTLPRWVALTSFYKFIHSYLLNTYSGDAVSTSKSLLSWSSHRQVIKKKKKKSKFAACWIVLSGLETRKGSVGGREVLF